MNINIITQSSDIEVGQ